jgi:uncharacterized caspase-like protein
MKFVINLLTASLLGILLIGCATLQESGGEKRVAMVIGNNDYPLLEKQFQQGKLERSPQLTKAVQDAQDVKESLKKLGFTVHYGENLSLAEMRTLLGNFTSNIDEQTLAFVYFSGHGSSDGTQLNYLIPTDFHGEGLAVDEIAFTMKDKKGTKNILALDMCRDNGIKLGQKGAKSLGKGDIAITSPYNPPIDPKKPDLRKHKDGGILISYATGGGNTSTEGNEPKNSIYTKALLSHIHDTSLSLSDLFGQVSNEVAQNSGKAQIPWKTGSLEGNDIFIAKGNMKSAGGARP